MGIKLNLHPVLSHYIENQQSAQVNGKTVAECLDHLANQCPQLRKFMYNEDGKLASFISVYVNDEDCDPGDLLRPVKDGDELSVELAGGGC